MVKMKIKLLQTSAIIYFLIAFLFLHKYNLFSIILLAIAFLIGQFTNIKNGIKNLLYLISALSIFPALLGLFLLYLPFAVFGFLLTKRSFIRNYVLGFAVSFIPVNIIYLITTYLAIPLNYPVILIIFYFLPLTAIILLNKKSLAFLEIDNKEGIFIFIVLVFTSIVAMNIVDDKSLFMANGVRIFSRVQVALEGLKKEGIVPIYNPGIAQGEATYLWNAPSFKVGAALPAYLLRSKSPIFFFNSQSFFILFLSTLALATIFWSVINKEESFVNMLAVAAVSVIIGLNFLFLQLLESFKAYYLYAISYLYVSIILNNPRKFNDFLILMYISVIMITVHIPYGSGMLLIGACLFLITKSYYLRDRSEIRYFFNWLLKNKLKISVTIPIIFLLPIFYISSGFIYKDFLDKNPTNIHVNIREIVSSSSAYLKGFYYNDLLSFLSLKYPDVNRIDDHKFGFFISVFGPISLFLLFLLYKSEHTKKIRIFALAFILNIIILSLIDSLMTGLVGGLFRTTGSFLLISMGASIATLICFFKNKYVKYILIAVVFVAFIHTIPYAKQNITNIHQEYFASGEVYKQEIDFVKKLPVDGRILTYGLFNNAVDFGGNYLTGKYFSRNERLELHINRTVFEQVHGQNSFGDPDIILSKSGTELSNYLILGGYKYLFVNACHPIGNYVVSVLYPNFTYPIYRNNCLLFLVVNNTNYIEKIDLVENIPDGIYKQKDGYKYIAISPYYNFDKNLNFKEKPKNPEALTFQRPTPTEVLISGNFEKNDFVVFKEQYFARWKAYMNDKEIPVMSNNHELVLIRTDKGNNILLKYIVLPKEKIFGILSLIAHLSFIVLLIYLLRTQKNGNGTT